MGGIMDIHAELMRANKAIEQARSRLQKAKAKIFDLEHGRCLEGDVSDVEALKAKIVDLEETVQRLIYQKKSWEAQTRR
jgi:hypothetical protein